MPENSAYFTSICSIRSVMVPEEDQLGGASLISLEAQSDLGEEGILSYIHENFPKFIEAIRYLCREDQELLLSYYLLKKTQNTLAIIHQSTQTLSSFHIRMAIKKLGTYLMLGKPTVEIMERILEGRGLEHPFPDNLGLSQIIDLYSKTHSFQRIAEALALHRPKIRRAVNMAGKLLLNDYHSSEELALGVYISGLVDQASATGKGYSSRKAAKQSNLFIVDPSILGEFRIDVNSPHFDDFLVARARH